MADEDIKVMKNTSFSTPFTGYTQTSVIIPNIKKPSSVFAEGNIFAALAISCVISIIINKIYNGS